MKKSIAALMASLGLTGVLAACAGVQQSPPEVSYDGLHLVPDTPFAEVYLKPGADLKVYEKFGVTDCQVAFRKNWLREQNEGHIDLTSRVTQKDVDRIKSQLGEACSRHFREALARDPAYDIVDQCVQGEEVLLLRPAIVNLDITAPDVRAAGMSQTYTTSAGEMTLYLELVDATTDEVIGRIVDRQKDFDNSYLT